MMTIPSVHHSSTVSQLVRAVVARGRSRLDVASQEMKLISGELILSGCFVSSSRHESVPKGWRILLVNNADVQNATKQVCLPSTLVPLPVTSEWWSHYGYHMLPH